MWYWEGICEIFKKQKDKNKKPDRIVINIVNTDPAKFRVIWKLNKHFIPSELCDYYNTSSLIRH